MVCFTVGDKNFTEIDVDIDEFDIALGYLLYFLLFFALVWEFVINARCPPPSPSEIEKGKERRAKQIRRKKCQDENKKR